LLSYPMNNIPASVGRLCIAITVILAYPINNFPARLAVVSLFFRGKEMSHRLFYFVTIVMFLLCLVIALAIPRVTVVFSIIGSTLGVAVIFIFPAMFAWKTRHKSGSVAWAIISAIILALVGIFIAGTGTGMTLYNIIKRVNGQ